MIDGYVDYQILAFIDLQVARCRLPVACCLSEKLKTTLWFRQLATCYLQPAAYYWLMPGLNRELQRATDYWQPATCHLRPATCCMPLPSG